MPVDRGVLALAARQHGVVSAAQLADAGCGRHWIAHRLATGWLNRRHRGVYLVGPLEAPFSAAMAAVLACGDGALLSHHPAAVLCGFRPPPVHLMHVTVRRDVRSRAGIRVHRVTGLDPRDAARRRGIPVTSAARTLLDLAATNTRRDLNRAVDEARIHRLVTSDSLNKQCSRYPRHPGTPALRDAIRTEPKLIRSEAERRLLELIRAARLPEPLTNARAGRYEVDFLWLHQRLIVEVDGYAFHSERSSFERDRRKDAELTLAGFRILRITWRQIVEEPEATVAILAAALAAQPRPSDFARSSTVSA